MLLLLPLLLLRLFLLSVGCCSPGKQEGIQSERGRQRERLCFIVAALLWHREPQTRCEEVDLGAGYRSADPWITSSE